MTLHGSARKGQARAVRKSEKTFKLLVNYCRVSFLLLFVDVVVQELDDQVDVGQNHASAAVTLASELVERVFGVNLLFVDQVEVAIPLVAHDFAAGEAANWNDHLYF